ncbi:MAG: hypothetical protein M3081_22380 [Gemmatimonadota bacterium]|nr:hypothetical protein [Gemmatimonadota bacterium]
MMMRAWKWWGAASLLALISWWGGPPSAGAQSAGPLRTHLVVITGVGGEPQYANAFYQAGASMVDAATKRLGIPDSLVVFLTEDPARDPTHRARKSSKDEIEGALTTVAGALKENDQLVVLLIGHGSGQGADSRFNVPGPDPSAADFAKWLDRAGTHPVVIVVATSASGDVLPVLSSPTRVVITATKSAMERNEIMFPRFFVAAFAADGADADKDGRVSILEAFNYAKAEVTRAYEADNRLQTEHPQLSDAGNRAKSTFLAAPRLVTSASGDPRVAALYTERQAIESRIDALKARKATTDSAAYAKQLESLLLELATKSAEIRQHEVKKP